MRNFLKWNWRDVVGASVLLTMSAVLGFTIWHSEGLKEQERNRKYQLIVATPYGPQMVPVYMSLITHLRRMGDGSICYDELQSGRHFCMKADNYSLFEMSN